MDFDTFIRYLAGLFGPAVLAWAADEPLEELALDSIARWEIVAYFEAGGFVINDEEPMSWRTLGDIFRSYESPSQRQSTKDA